MRFVWKVVKSIFQRKQKRLRSMIVWRPKVFMDKEGTYLAQALFVTLWNMQPRSQGPLSTSRKYPGCGWSRVYVYKSNPHRGWIIDLKEKVIPKSVYFLSSPIKSLYWVELLNEVSASKVRSIPGNYSPKKPRICNRQPPFWNKYSASRPG